MRPPSFAASQPGTLPQALLLHSGTRVPWPFSHRPASLTWFGHAFAHSNGVFPLPLLQLFLHLVDFGRIEGPQTALSRGTSRFILHLLKALVERQVMANRILPAIRRSLPKQESRLGSGSKGMALGLGVSRTFINFIHSPTPSIHRISTHSGLMSSLI